MIGESWDTDRNRPLCLLRRWWACSNQVAPRDWPSTPSCTAARVTAVPAFVFIPFVFRLRSRYLSCSHLSSIAPRLPHSAFRRHLCQPLSPALSFSLNSSLLFCAAHAPMPHAPLLFFLPRLGRISHNAVIPVFKQHLILSMLNSTDDDYMCNINSDTGRSERE